MASICIHSIFFYTFPLSPFFVCFAVCECVDDVSFEVPKLLSIDVNELSDFKS